LREEKINKSIWLPAILRGRLQSREDPSNSAGQAAKASGSHTERPQFLCAPQFYGAGLCSVKKEKNKSRKVGKAQRPPEVIPSGYNFFAALRPTYRRQALREEKIKICLPAILRDRH
jgi:hypothetical protein